MDSSFKKNLVALNIAKWIHQWEALWKHFLNPYIISWYLNYAHTVEVFTIKAFKKACVQQFSLLFYIDSFLGALFLNHVDTEYTHIFKHVVIMLNAATHARCIRTAAFFIKFLCFTYIFRQVSERAFPLFLLHLQK